LFFDDFRLYSVAAKKAGAAMCAVRIHPALPTTSGANDLAGSDQTLTAFAA
jgi:hypothetical protein